MVDYTKFELPSYFEKILKENSLLEFQAKVDLNGGLIGDRSIAYYRGLTFTIYESKRITVAGSLHKYWNKGKHNFNDFSTENLLKVLNDLKNKFKITPDVCDIKQLEIGINFRPPYTTKEILASCLLHKTSQLKWIFTPDEGNYKQVMHRNYYIKVYDKQKHYTQQGYKIPSELMRFEIKYRRNKLNNQLGITGKITLQDILDYNFKYFTDALIKEWRNILFYDWTSLENSSYKDRYSNDEYWLNLKQENFKYHRNKLNKIISANPNNLKKDIEARIEAKCKLLTAPTTRISTLYIETV